MRRVAPVSSMWQSASALNSIDESSIKKTTDHADDFFCVDLCASVSSVGSIGGLGIENRVTSIEHPVPTLYSSQYRPSLNLLMDRIDVPAMLCFAASFELKLESHRIDGRHGRELALRRMSGALDRIHALAGRQSLPRKLPHQTTQKCRFHQGPPKKQIGGLILCAHTVSIERRIGGRR